MLANRGNTDKRNENVSLETGLLAGGTELGTAWRGTSRRLAGACSSELKGNPGLTRGPRCPGRGLWLTGSREVTVSGTEARGAELLCG